MTPSAPPFRFWSWLGLLVISAGLFACKPEMTVRLASAREWLPEPRFLIEEVDRRGQRPRYHGVQVLDETGRVLWALRAEPFGDQNSARDLTYGVTPPGFVAITPPAELKPGVEYFVIVEGTARGGLRFFADATGLVSSKTR